MAPPTTREYWSDWYEVVTSPELRQGDIFRNMLAFWLPQDLPVLSDGQVDSGVPPIGVQCARADWIVLSASCDIVRGDDTHVLLARVAEANAANLKAGTPKVLKEKLEVLRKGFDPARFLLAPCYECDPPLQMSVIVYRQQAFPPLKYMQAHCSALRVRLRPPFREKFGAWAGANLGRVGVEDPSQIPPQARYTAPVHILNAIDEPPAP